MPTKNWMIVPCAFVALLACDVEETEVEAQSVVLEESSASTRPTALTAIANDKAVTQNYCDHADRVLRAEVLNSGSEADGDLTRERERVLLDGLRAGEAVFAGAERLLVRGADEVHVGFEDGWLIAEAPGVDAPLARLRLADGVKAHVLAEGVRKLVLTESIRKADIAHLIVLTDLDGAVTVDVAGAPSCLVIDGGGDAAAGPLTVNQVDEITSAPNPTRGTLHGTNNQDALFGGPGDDVIYGYGDRDFIDGREGVDTLYGNEGNDEIWSGPSVPGYTQLVFGGRGNDVIYGSADTFCYGDGGTNVCYFCSSSASCIAL